MNSPTGAARGNIALVANYESDVGYAWWLMENFWAAIALQAQRDGRQCVLAYPRIGASIPAKVRDAPIEIHEFGFSRAGPGAVLRTAKFMRAHGVRTVYLTDWPYLHWCYLVWRCYGVRRIVIHDHTPGVRPPIGGLRGLAKRLAFAARVFSANQYVAVSRYVGRRHVLNARVPAQLGVVVENGILPFDPAAVARDEVRARIGVPANAVLVALCSRATYYKGLDVAVRAVAALPDAADAPLYAVHCGDGPDLEAFRKLAAELGVDKRFMFLGRRNDVRDILSSADIAFHPSRGEAMSLAILEFMCAGLPVVVPDDESVCTSIEHEVSGLVYPKKDVAAASAALRRLRDDPALRARLGAAARRICLERYLLGHTNASFARQVVALL